MKNVGVPETPLASALRTSSATRAAWRRRRRSSEKRSRSRPSADAWRKRSAGRERVLVAEQPVVHLPERALGARGLGRLGGDLRVRVHVGQRQVAEDVAQLVAEVVEQLGDDRRRVPAVRALEVAVLEQRDRRVGPAADVVALGVDVVGEVDDRLGGGAELARAHLVGQQRA